jgi:predicted nucleic acid-binding protein
MAALRDLADTNLLVRLVTRHDPEFALVRGGLRALLVQSARRCDTPQPMAECWHVSTRPSEHKGYGLTPLEADRRARRIERAFTWLLDSEVVSRERQRLIVAHAVSGMQVSDARLVVVMKGHDVTHLLTLNDDDCVRYAGITVVHLSRVPICISSGHTTRNRLLARGDTPDTACSSACMPHRREDVRGFKRYGFSGTTAVRLRAPSDLTPRFLMRS